MSMLCCEMKVSHARSVHWLYDCPSQTRKEDIMGIDISHTHTVEVGYDEFCGALAARDLQPLWKIAKQLMPEDPLPATQAWLWKWDDVLPIAIRFVLTGSGVYTTVNGDACDMEPGDLILTPNWTWHDHNNKSDDPVVWFDGLDLPLLATLESIFFENHPDQLQPVEGHNGSEQRFAGVGLREMGATSPVAHSPLLRYRWEETERTLESLHQARGGPMISLEFVNPLTGGPAVSTFACEMHRIYPGERTPSRRKTGSSVYVVFQGSGRSVINGLLFEWGPGDIFVTPSWASVDHEANVRADLFAISDRPILQVLHLHREEELAERQEISGMFESVKSSRWQSHN